MTAPSSPPTISVIIATHERPQLLRRALDSLVAQERSDFEIVVVDDASRDDTPQRLETWARDEPRLRWLRNADNLGPAGSRNRAIDAARGRYVAILDDDDVCRPERLRLQAAILDADPSIGLVAAPVRWVDAAGQPFRIFSGALAQGRFPGDPADAFRLLYLDSNKIPTTAVMLRTAVLEPLRAAGEEIFDPRLRVGEDWLLFLRLFSRGVRSAAISTPLVDMLRDASHASLMGSRRRAFSDQRRVLDAIRADLAARDDRRFDGLHRRALGRQLAREARFWTGWKGLALAHRALVVAPGDPFVREAARWMRGRALGKLRPGRSRSDSETSS
ncbi:MAG: glycosyltransferase family 2 protein [Acidobacteriota bacterium]